MEYGAPDTRLDYCLLPRVCSPRGGKGGSPRLRSCFPVAVGGCWWLSMEDMSRSLLANGRMVRQAWAWRVADRVVHVPDGVLIVIIIQYMWSVPEGEGDQRKKGAPCHEPGYEIHIHWPDESKCRICLYTKSKTSMAPVAKESATAKIGLERAFNLRSPFVRSPAFRGKDKQSLEGYSVKEMFVKGEECGHWARDMDDLWRQLHCQSWGTFIVVLGGKARYTTGNGRLSHMAHIISHKSGYSTTYTLYDIQSTEYIDVHGTSSYCTAPMHGQGRSRELCGTGTLHTFPIQHPTWFAQDDWGRGYSSNKSDSGQYMALACGLFSPLGCTEYTYYGVTTLSVLCAMC
ncbi:hypothetical protein PCH_Pc13g10340 [Penicillium rubens Wisconsin 54-1255]|uniref:Uncharacterized protein n=1 Tax=Penicillium rubens (strain ATCC 28089 / DSM 1075 / NRRL 1951 / Wisconsin 54-1255) TaxID=500485 RepID=B6H4T4_PENRW|nr:hypothetical protein PCH_Pc13g10340 [Penicillium rubens Wisconsin 54-1255]